MSRGVTRLKALAGAMLDAVGRPRLNARPTNPTKILVLHELLLGDTLMLAPLLAALRRRYPVAEIFVTSPPAYAPLLGGRPYGVTVLPFSERDQNALAALVPARNCDIAILPGENRYALIARALNARWVVAFAGGKPAWKNRAADELVAMPTKPASLADIFALLADPDDIEQKGIGRNPKFSPLDWPAPQCAAFERPESPYAVLHVGAGSPLRLWEPRKWRAVADALSGLGVQPVWSAGRGETDLVRAIDPHGVYASYGGRLDLAQLWHLLACAKCAVTLDTGVAHLAKLTGTRVAVLFGPGSAELFGKGEFWRVNDFQPVTRADFPCRDQTLLFKREIAWVRRCNRGPRECPRPRCMEAIAPEQVLAALHVE